MLGSVGVVFPESWAAIAAAATCNTRESGVCSSLRGRREERVRRIPGRRRMGPGPRPCDGLGIGNEESGCKSVIDRCAKLDVGFISKSIPMSIGSIGGSS